MIRIDMIIDKDVAGIGCIDVIFGISLIDGFTNIIIIYIFFVRNVIIFVIVVIIIV